MNDSDKRCWKCIDFRGLQNPVGMTLGHGQCLKFGHVIEFADEREYHACKCIEKPTKVIEKTETVTKKKVKLTDNPKKGRPKRITAVKLFEDLESEVIE